MSNSMCPSLQTIKRFASKNNVHSTTMGVILKSFIDKNLSGTNTDPLGNATDEEIDAYIENWLNTGTPVVYTQRGSYRAVHDLWNKYFKNGPVKVSARQVDSILERFGTLFGEEAIITRQLPDGRYSIYVTEPLYQKKEVARRATPEKQETAYEKAANLVKDMKARAEKHVKFDAETHTYYIDGVAADTTVSRYTEGKVPDTQALFLLTASRLGNTVDTIARDFFSGNLKGFDKYGNLTSEQFNDLVKDLLNLRKYFDKKFKGKKYTVVTDEIPIYGKLSNGKTIAGTMDMLVYDEDGNFYMYDFKTSRSDLNARVNKGKRDGYFRQQQMYKAILNTNYGFLNKIKEQHLIYFTTGYEAPVDATVGRPGLANYSYSEDLANNLIMVSYQGKKAIPIQRDPAYEAPRLATDLSSAEGIDIALITVPDKNLDKELTAMTQQQIESMAEEANRAAANEVKASRKEAAPTKKDKARQGLHRNPILKASEVTFLANTAMQTLSATITMLQTGAKNSKGQSVQDYLGEEFSRDKINFSKMSREDIVKVPGLINAIMYYIKETRYNPNRGRNVNKPELVRQKLQIAYDNWSALMEEGYAKLISLEGVTLSKSIVSDDINKDGIDESLREQMDSVALEQGEQEYWQIGQRQLSAKSGLSNEVRRAFEKLRQYDSDGNPAVDSTFGMPLYVDAGEAVNHILDWCKECTTIEEMEEILGSMLETNPWLNGILDAIQEEPFRSQFYQNFRKDFTRYSIVTLNQETGNYEVTIINTKGAVSAFMSEITDAFKVGAMKNLIIAPNSDVEGKGRVNTAYLEKLDAKLVSLKQAFADDFRKNSDKSKRTRAVVKHAKELAQLLNEVGINVEEKDVIAYLTKEAKKRNLDNTTLGGGNGILTNLSYMFDTLHKNEGRNDYNPIAKEESHDNNSIYGNYKNILTHLETFITDRIESSTYENGKMHYSFVTPSYMGKLALNLSDALSDEEKFVKFLKDNYAQYRWFCETEDGELDGVSNITDLGRLDWRNKWLQLLTSDSKMREGFQHKVQLNFMGTPYNELSEMNYTLSLMTEYFYDQRSSKKNSWAWYSLPTMSNKPSSEFIRFKRYRGNYKSEIKDGMWEVMQQEILRIKTVLERASNPNIAKITSYDISDKVITKDVQKILAKFNSHKLTISDLKTLQNSLSGAHGAEFKFLPFLNDAIQNNPVLAQGIVDSLNNKDTDTNAFSDAFDDALEEYMNEVTATSIANWKNLGLFESEQKKDSKGNVTTKYKYLGFLGKAEESIIDQLEEYIWNDTFATINIIQLTCTDLAYYKDSVDFQKRFAQVHSPSLKLNKSAKDSKGVKYSADGLERTVILKDQFILSDIKENVAQAFDARIANAKPKDKIALLALKDRVVREFDNIDVDNAQGYSSPTSYRKKLGMQGKWTQQMEDAYERIKRGDYTVRDLDIVWQPLKPFAYGHSKKSTGANAMSTIKVNIQEKNSEYLLLLADAIIRGGNKTNRLTAIFDFMEESAYDGRVMKNGKVIKEGTYNGKGIDTVQFESAVKVGLMGVIDINDAYSYDEIKDRLNQVYYNEDRTESSENGNSRYVDAFVHEIDFDDYGIQQEVPAHLNDHEQLIGSQKRILVISDITPGTKFLVGKDAKEMDDAQLRSEYQSLHAANIRESFDQLVADLKLDNADPKVRNKALSDLLVEAIKKDQRYGADLLRACQLDENGEFNIPLCDPIQSTRIQQLLNSIIKSRINKQKVKGGPVVQTTAYGLSDDVSVRFQDKDGNILKSREQFFKEVVVRGKKIFKGNEDFDKLSVTYMKEMKDENLSEESQKFDMALKLYRKYLRDNQASIAYFEAYAPVPSSDLEELLRKDDGSLMTFEEAVKAGVVDSATANELSKAIGYRIPTEDKYSMMPIKIKGFVPKAAGEAIILPREITLLTGSDFDIDKMYIELKAFEARRAIDRQKEAFNDLKRFLNTGTKDAVDDFLGKIYDTYSPEKRSEYASRLINGNKNAGEPRLSEIISNISKGLPMNNTAEVINDWLTENGYSKVKSFSEVSIANIKDYKENNKSNRDMRRQMRNNRLFDLQWAVLTHSDTFDKMFNPQSFDNHKIAAKITSILSSTDKYTYSQLKEIADSQPTSGDAIKALDKLAPKKDTHSIILPSSKVYFFKQNMTGAKLVGIFANNNTSHAFLSDPRQDIRLKLDEDESFYFNGFHIKDDIKLDPMRTLDGGGLVSKEIASYLAAALDCAKAATQDDLNINTATAGTGMLLARLGFRVDEIGLFLRQPIIVKLANEYFKKNNEGFTSMDSVINELADALEEKIGKGAKDIALKNLSDTKFTADEMGANIDENWSMESSNKRKLEYQLKALLLFQKLNNIATNMNTLTFMTKFNSVTNAVGPTIADTQVMELRIAKFKKDMESKPMFNENALHIIENSPLLKAFYDNTVGSSGASAKIFEPYFPNYSERFKEILETLNNSTRSILDSKLINRLANDFVLYKLTIATRRDSAVLDFSKEERADLIYRTPNIVAAFRMDNYTKEDRNALLSVITSESPTSKVPVSTVGARTGGYSIDVQENIKNAWSDLIEDEETRDFALRLFKYNILRSGFGFSPRTFLHLASTDVKEVVNESLGYLDAISDPRFHDLDVNVATFLNQFRRNHSTNNKVVPEIEKFDKTIRVVRGKRNNRPTITLNFNSKKQGINKVISNTNSNRPEYLKMIKYEDKLWELVENSATDSSVTYIETTPLGIAYNFLEYNANEGSSISTAISAENKRLYSQMDSEDEADDPDDSKGDSSDDLTQEEVKFLEEQLGESVIARAAAMESDEQTDEFLLKKIENRLGKNISDKSREKLEAIKSKFCKG